MAAPADTATDEQRALDRIDEGLTELVLAQLEPEAEQPAEGAEHRDLLRARRAQVFLQEGSALLVELRADRGAEPAAVLVDPLRLQLEAGSGRLQQQEGREILVSVSVADEGGHDLMHRGRDRKRYVEIPPRFEPELRSVLKKGGFLTRDARTVERKKYGRAKARKSFQFSKR